MLLQVLAKKKAKAAPMALSDQLAVYALQELAASMVEPEQEQRPEMDEVCHQLQNLDKRLRL